MLFDKMQLFEDIGGDDETVQSLLDCAITEIPKEVEKLKVCCKNGDTTEIYLQAHGIKSMAADLYAPDLREICAKLEAAAKQGDLKTALGFLPELELVAGMTVEAIGE